MLRTPRPPLPRWWHFELTLTAPAFLGGAIPRSVDRDTPLRPASIRGALRHWLRLGLGELLGGGGGGEGARREALHGLRRLEAILFGAVSRAPGLEPDDMGASRVLIKPPKLLVAPKGGAVQSAKTPAQGGGLRYMCYGVFDSAGEVTQIPADCRFELAVGLRFRSLDSTEQREALQGALAAVLYLWGELGGIGARSRRGWGGVQLALKDDAQGPWPALFPAQRPTTRGDLIQSLNKGLSLVSQGLARFARAFGVSPPPKPQPIPELRTLAGLQKLRVLPFSYPSSELAIDRAGELMRDFRSTLARNNRRLRPLDDYFVVRAALERGGDMPAVERAAFGLPLPFYFRSLGGRKGNLIPTPPAAMRWRGQRPDRMPSALLFRVAKVGDLYAMMLLYLEEARPSLGACTLRLRRGGPPREDSFGPGPSGRLVLAFMDEAMNRVNTEGR